MKRYYVKSLKEYEKPVKLDHKKILDSIDRLGGDKKLPTSVALEIAAIRDLKKLAQKKRLPYQTLMRMFIMEGLRRSKRAA